MNTLPPSTTPPFDDRWRFLRDVVVFQIKMMVDNLRDFALIPISLAAAAIDLIFKGQREGALFYKVLKWGAHSEKVIDVYSAIEQDEIGPSPIHRDFTIDGVVARLEGVMIREYEKGGTAANLKAAMDRAIDQLHNETGSVRDKATGLVALAADKLRSVTDTGEPPEPHA